MCYNGTIKILDISCLHNTQGLLQHSGNTWQHKLESTDPVHNVMVNNFGSQLLHQTIFCCGLNSFNSHKLCWCHKSNLLSSYKGRIESIYCTTIQCACEVLKSQSLNCWNRAGFRILYCRLLISIVFQNRPPFGIQNICSIDQLLVKYVRVCSRLLLWNILYKLVHFYLVWGQCSWKSYLMAQVSEPGNFVEFKTSWDVN